MSQTLIARVAVLAATFLWPYCLLATSVGVVNHSFESPATSFVSINIDSWQKPPKPAWYVENGGFLWAQLTGIFKNTTNTSPDHITNCDGAQAIWMFAVPEVGLSQDYNAVDLDDPFPSHAFDVRYEIGRSYRLTVGVIGSGGGMKQGATLELSLYYGDSVSNRVTVAANTLTNLSTVFSNNTYLVDCHVNVPVVQADDAWAGQRMGIMFLSTVTTNLQGGYWDLDNVRLTSVLEVPRLSGTLQTNGQFTCTVQGEPGYQMEILWATSTVQDWTSIGTFSNTTGMITFTEPVASAQRRYFRARQSP